MNIANQIKKPGSRAQAIVEFAIVMPVLMMLLVGIFEVGRMMLIYSAVTNASREASRYASAVGLDRDPDNGNYYTKYNYCKGIRSIAKRSAYFMNLSNSNITIAYDTGPDPVTGVIPPPFHANCSGDVDTSFGVSPGNRVKVTINATYKPLIKLIPIGSKPITSSSTRTILGVLELVPY